jgi:hypothetical protein
MIEQTSGHTTLSRPRVELIGTDGNAFAVLGLVLRALRDVGWSQHAIDAFTGEATAGDYDHLLRTVMKYVDVE